MSTPSAAPPDPSPAAPAGPARSARGRALLTAAVLTASAVVAGTGAYVVAQHSSPGRQQRAGAVAAPVLAPTASVTGLTAEGRLAWRGRLAVQVADGELTGVTGTGPDGTTVRGTLGPDRLWTADRGLVPSATYRLTATARDAAGQTRTLPALVVRTTAPERTLEAAVSPGDGRVVGVGQPVVVRLDRAVTTTAAREAVEERLAVTATPSVAGAWHWVSASELHYRPARFWPAGTKVRVRADLDHLALPGGVWGSGVRTSSYAVGSALVSVVDTRAHTMTVRRDGRVLRVMRASTGKPQFPTRNGVFIVLEKFADRIMDSATVDLPPGTPAYRTAVKHAVRITNSGTFTHGAPWSVRSQGVANVSHGCVNLSPADAKWYFDQAKRGDVVEVVGSTQGPVLSDAGSADWNMSYARWKSGGALL